MLKAKATGNQQPAFNPSEQVKSSPGHHVILPRTSPLANINGDAPPMLASVSDSKLSQMAGGAQHSPRNQPDDEVLSRPKARPKFLTLSPPLPGATNSFAFRGGPLQGTLHSKAVEVTLRGQPELPPGDNYTGTWLHTAPESVGTYHWADGASYSGEWQRGVKHGFGKYTWPDGSMYEGEFCSGLMEGEGTYGGARGGTYTGGWIKGRRSGLGMEKFANSDFYNGLWAKNEPHGPGRYHWADGSEYNGEMRGGHREGRGTLVWATGEMYFGECVEGVEHGRAVYTKVDRSFYDGVWVDGQRHGFGVHFPPATGHGGKVMILEYNAGVLVKEEVASEKFLSSYKLPPMHAQTPAHMSRLMHLQNGEHPDEAEADPSVKPKRASSNRFRDLAKSFNPNKSNNDHDNTDVKKEVRQLSARQNRRGSVMWGKQEQFEGNKVGKNVKMESDNYDLMLNLKLGIQCSVSTGQRMKKRPCNKGDFENDSKKKEYPRLGSSVGGTPPHASKDFVFKEYYPVVFRNLRELFRVNPGAFISSICGDISLRELPTPGKSGAAFFVSSDDRYFIKTMTKGEVQLLKKMLPRYYEHMMENKHSLLVKFYGMYWIKTHTNQTLYMVVMGNILHSEAPIHRRYDLKGSTVGRYSKMPAEEIKPTSMLKDLDIDMRFKIDSKWRNMLMEQVRKDCLFLEENDVMDYSMLLGVHFRAAKSNEHLARTLGLKGGKGENDVDEAAQTAAKAAYQNRVTTINNLAKKPAIQRRMSIAKGTEVKYDQQEVAESLNFRPWTEKDRRLHDFTAKERAARNNWKKMSRAPLGELLTTETLAAKRGRETALGIAMVASAFPERVFEWPSKEAGPPRASTLLHPQEAVLEFGVIDILQAYNVRKKIEHVWKGVEHKSSKTISSVNPISYSKRFQKFMAELFVPAQ